MGCSDTVSLHPKYQPVKFAPGDRNAARHFVIHSTITDQEKLDAYLAQAFPTLPSEGFRVLAIDDAPQTIEGEAPGKRLVIVEADSEERFQAWYNSPKYQAIRQLRLDGSEGFALLAAGFEPG